MDPKKVNDKKEDDDGDDGKPKRVFERENVFRKPYEDKE